MAKEYYHGTITDQTDWGGDNSTGGLQVGGDRIQEWIKGKVSALEGADAASEKKNPSVFGGFVDNVTLKNTDAGSDYVKVVYDTTRHTFFAVTMDGTTEKYHRLYDKFAVYNDGEWPNAHPYSGKIYVYGGNIYQWDGTQLVCSLISQEEFDEIFPIVDPEPEEEEEENS